MTVTSPPRTWVFNIQIENEQVSYFLSCTSKSEIKNQNLCRATQMRDTVNRANDNPENNGHGRHGSASQIVTFVIWRYVDLIFRS